MSKLSAATTSIIYIFFHMKIRMIFWEVGCRAWGCKLNEICGNAPEKNASAPSPLKVVLPSAGQTATSSVDLALRYMGYKVYHIEEKYVYAGRILQDVEDNEEFRRAVAGCNVEALSLEPPWDNLPHALQTAPDAKYIMTWRDYPGWYKSSTAVGEPMGMGGKHGRWHTIIFDVAKSWSLCPWGFLYDQLTGEISSLYREGTMFNAPEQVTVMSYIIMRLMGRYGVEDFDNGYDRGNYKLAGHEEAYLAHQDEIRRTVPPGQLLVFDAKKHGWQELEQFLGRPAPKNLPFPHVRSKASWTNDAMCDHRLDIVVQVLTIFLVMHVVNYTIVHLWVKLCLRVLWKVASFCWMVASCCRLVD